MGAVLITATIEPLRQFRATLSGDTSVLEFGPQKTITATLSAYMRGPKGDQGGQGEPGESAATLEPRVEDVEDAMNFNYAATIEALLA